MGPCVRRDDECAPLLRRLNLVRSALRRADPANASVAEIARSYQFQELGRFAVTYRTVFGEMPSSTLRRKSIRNINLPKSHSVCNATCGKSPDR
jgi:AraC-like DNA-binding protein